MTKIILSGCNGAMGRVITALIDQRIDAEIVAGVDVNTEKNAGFPVFANPANCQINADVIIDFSHPSALSGVLELAVSTETPVVVATTGISENQIGEIEAASKVVPVFFSGNMSIGISLMMALAKKATAVLGRDFDIEIIEKHHNKKIDAPSGTAFMLANEIAKQAPYSAEFVYERESKRERRKPNEIGISSIRGGTIVGEHEIIFAGNDELISLTHTALSKNIFAVGAVNAALFLMGHDPGLYNMSDFVKEA